MLLELNHVWAAEGREVGEKRRGQKGVEPGANREKVKLAAAVDTAGAASKRKTARAKTRPDLPLWNARNESDSEA